MSKNSPYSVEIDEIIPTLWDNKKFHKRIGLALMTPRHVLATYNETGCYVIFDIDAKEVHPVTMPNGFKGYTKPIIMEPYIFSIHEGKEEDRFAVYNLRTRKTVFLKVEANQKTLGVLPSDSCCIVVTEESIYMYKLPDETPLKINSNPAQCCTPTPKLSEVASNSLLIGSYDRFQLWSRKKGEILSECKLAMIDGLENASTFLELLLSLPYIIGITSAHIVIWNSTRMEDVPTIISPSFFITAAMTYNKGDSKFVVVGGVEGQIYRYKINSGKLENVIHDNPKAQNGEALSFFMRQLRTTAIKGLTEYGEFLLGTSDHEITFWSRITDQEEPLRSKVFKDKIKEVGVGADNNVITVLLSKKIVQLQIPNKKLKAAQRKELNASYLPRLKVQFRTIKDAQADISKITVLKYMVSLLDYIHGVAAGKIDVQDVMIVLRQSALAVKNLHIPKNKSRDFSRLVDVLGAYDTFLGSHKDQFWSYWTKKKQARAQIEHANSRLTQEVFRLTQLYGRKGLKPRPDNVNANNTYNLLPPNGTDVGSDEEDSMYAASDYDPEEASSKELGAFLNKLGEQERNEEYSELFWDSDAIQFWKDNFHTVALVQWDVFIAALQKALFVTKKDVENLKRVLDHNGAGYISAHTFASFLEGNGPFAECIDKMNSYCTKPWFHWYLDHEECSFLLFQKPIGTFIARFSRSQPGNFAFSVRTNTVVEKWLVKSSNGMLSGDFRSPDVPSFGNIADFIEYYGKTTFLKNPFDEMWPSEPWFRGNLDQILTTNLLKEAPDGSFLARIGSKGYYYVMAYREGDNVLQERVYPEPGKFTVKNSNGFKTYYVPTMKEFVQSRSKRYQLPCIPNITQAFHEENGAELESEYTTIDAALQGEGVAYNYKDVVPEKNKEDMNKLAEFTSRKTYVSIPSEDQPKKPRRSRKNSLLRKKENLKHSQPPKKDASTSPSTPKREGKRKSSDKIFASDNSSDSITLSTSSSGKKSLKKSKDKKPKKDKKKKRGKDRAKYAS